jgi:prophage antirepressor-like protein
MAPPCKYQTDEERIEGRRERQRKYTEKDWYCDVCDCTIGLGNKTNHLKSKKHLKCECNTCSSTSESDLEPREADEDQEPYISEPGVYGLILGSKTPSADSFQTWLFEEVLPSIRKF